MVALIVLLINDAALFTQADYDAAGVVLVLTNIGVVALIFSPLINIRALFLQSDEASESSRASVALADQENPLHQDTTDKTPQTTLAIEMTSISSSGSAEGKSEARL